MYGIIFNTKPIHCIIISKTALFIRSENKTAPKLIIEISGRYFKLIIFIIKKPIGDAIAFIIFKAKQWVGVIFITKSGRKIIPFINEVRKTIAQHFFRNFRCAD